jgi:hypothetical protein
MLRRQRGRRPQRVGRGELPQDRGPVHSSGNGLTSPAAKAPAPIEKPLLDTYAMSRADWRMGMGSAPFRGTIEWQHPGDAGQLASTGWMIGSWDRGGERRSRSHAAGGSVTDELCHPFRTVRPLPRHRIAHPRGDPLTRGRARHSKTRFDRRPQYMDHRHEGLGRKGVVGAVVCASAPALSTVDPSCLPRWASRWRLRRRRLFHLLLPV